MLQSMQHVKDVVNKICMVYAWCSFSTCYYCINNTTYRAFVAFVLVCLCAGVAYLNLRSHRGSSCSRDINYTCCHDLYVGMGRRQEEGRERERERLLMSREPKRNQHNLLNKIRNS